MMTIQKQYDQTYQTIQPRLSTCASSAAAWTGTDCLNHDRHKKEEEKQFLFLSFLSAAAWAGTLSISSLSMMSGSSLLGYNYYLNPCHRHYYYQFQVILALS